MAIRTFRSYAEASAFAKELAVELGRTVKLTKNEGTWQVEVPSEALAAPSVTKVASTLFSHSVPPPSPPILKRKTSPAQISKPVPPSRVCIECGCIIPSARLKASPNSTRCVKCQSDFERVYDTTPRVDEGLAGTRDAHKRMKAQLWGDIRNRGRGK